MCVRRAHARLRVMFRDDIHRYTYMHAWIIDELQVRENDRVKAPMSGAKWNCRLIFLTLLLYTFFYLPFILYPVTSFTFSLFYAAREHWSNHAAYLLAADSIVLVHIIYQDSRLNLFRCLSIQRFFFFLLFSHIVNILIFNLSFFILLTLG